MTINVEARAVLGHRRASEIAAVAADLSEIAQAPIDFQMRRILRRFDFSPERARAVAELAFASTGRRA
ncbi:MAG: hypothetical protein K2X71_06220 [Methylobacterium sp.]|uniref:hypothetical protein n=1 Tax=Methylobacterium sp. TaxID=409 RepID=UPI0025879721|nr:hypothetical protein [Methylobacterium sp.]MBY0295620.1 hypothetical protein [Methylobacterium sp.]